MPSDAVWVALITAVAGVVGGVIGAVASPIGRDWVARREDGRQIASKGSPRRCGATDRLTVGPRRIRSVTHV